MTEAVKDTDGDVMIAVYSPTGRAAYEELTDAIQSITERNRLSMTEVIGLLAMVQQRSIQFLFEEERE